MTTDTDKPKPRRAARPIVGLPPPVECPHCHGTHTRAAFGVHYNLRRRVRIEGRVCLACGGTFTGERVMSRDELAQHAPKAAR